MRKALPPISRRNKDKSMSASFRKSRAMNDPEQRFGNYILVERLGRGGFADVYLGEHIYLRTHAAVKIVRPQLSRADMRKFLTEARLSAHLRHPHIVRVLEFGQEGSVPFLVMDYAPNGTVRQRYPEGARPAISVILEYVEQHLQSLSTICSNARDALQPGPRCQIMKESLYSPCRN
jgi:serine/threonine protein kinase